MQREGNYPVLVDRRVFVTASDGTRLALTLYLPDAPNDGPFPAVLESLPYRKDDDCTARDYSTYAYMAGRGIAGIRLDIRGTGASTGVIADEYLAIEQEDNLEVLDWAAGQDWCTGNLGMWGISWGGFSSLQTAMLRPPQLKAIVAMHATHDRFGCDVHYRGGSLHAQEQVDWPTSMVATNALPPDPDIVGDTWFEEWMARLDGMVQWPPTWLSHQRRDHYWVHGSVSSDYAAIECPTLLVGGWLDGYVDGILALSENLSCPTRTVIGPWGHYRPSTGIPLPTFDHLDLMARWFGHHLRGDENGVMDMAAMTAFMRTTPPYDGESVDGYWCSIPEWPSPKDGEMIVGFDRGRQGSETWTGPQWVGKHAPAWDLAGVGSTDSSPDDAMSVAFDSAPWTEPIAILGTPTVSLRVSTNTDVGMVAVRLMAMSPEGVGHLLSRGSLNLAFRESMSEPRVPEPAVPIDIVIPLMATSAVLQPGWALRVAVAGADFPVIWPPSKRFILTIDPEATRLRLPRLRAQTIIELESSPPPPDPPVSFDQASSDWDIVSSSDGVTTIRRSKSSRQTQHSRDRLQYQYDQSWSVSVADDDPTSTRVDSSCQMRLSRPGWDVTVAGSLEISGAVDLEVVIAITAEHNGVTVHRSAWNREIPRMWV